MITSGYNLTATERVLPRMALDFTTASLDSRVTITRSLNTATRINSSGYIETVNANLPRFDFSPTSVGTCRGLLIEESRANLVLQSSDFTTASWTKTDTTPTAASGTSPDGTNTATLLTQGSAAASEVLQVMVVGAGNTVTYSRYVKIGNAQWYMLQIRNGGATSFAYAFFDLTNGVVGSTSSGGGFATLYGSTITPAGGGWFRVTFTVMIGAAFGTAVFASSSVTANGTATPASGGTRYEWGCQAEVGAFATSYIPTTTTSLTRNADAVNMTGTNFSNWFNASEGTFALSGSIFVNQGATTVNFLQVSNGVSNSVAMVLGMFDLTGPLWQVLNTTTSANLDLGTLTLNTVFNMAGTYKVDSFAGAMNGGTVQTDSTGTIPTVSQMGIGNRLSGPYMNGHVRKIQYWPQRLLNAEVQAFSK